jgi:hypothetical protein
MVIGTVGVKPPEIDSFFNTWQKARVANEGE